MTSETTVVYPWGHAKPYNDYTTYSKGLFNERVQKISIDAGFSCPNRDGVKAKGGCTYCNNHTFNPFYCDPRKSIATQLTEGVQFFSEKYKTQKYLAYFQAYSNTYGPLAHLKKLYEEALAHPQVIGLVISTRPDCVDAEKLNYIQELAQKYFIVMEYGIESTHNPTLDLINRCHTWEETQWALNLSKDRGIHLGGHLILGLPGEDREILLSHARKISELPIQTLKIHQLQITKHTGLSRQYIADPKSIKLFYKADDYIELLVEFLELLNPRIIIERFISETPPDLLVAPFWGGVKNYEFVARVERRLKELNTWQGRLYKPAQIT